MSLTIAVFLAGALTVFSPCILPLLPVVLSRAGAPFSRAGLPFLAGMAVAFALAGSLAAVAGGWAVRASEYGRWAAWLVLGLAGLSLTVPRLAQALARPWVALGARLAPPAQPGPPSVRASLLLGVSSGLIWTPCAGPVLGLVLGAAALGGANAGTVLLLLSYASGAALALAIVLLAGGRLRRALPRWQGLGARLRQGLGALMLMGVAASAFGLDTTWLARLSLASTTATEQALLDRFVPAHTPAGTNAADGAFGPLDPREATAWLNGDAPTTAELQGRVVLVNFWTYSCINCLRSLPYVKAWAERYGGEGLEVIGVHAPEFAFEKEPRNVARAVRELGLRHRIAMDNRFAIWRAFSNHYWPALYLLGPDGRVRERLFGEGDFARFEQAIRRELQQAGYTRAASAPLSTVHAEGVGQAADARALRSGEAYLGWQRAEGFAPPGELRADTVWRYQPQALALNRWTLGGPWLARAEYLEAADGSAVLRYRFHARDAHLVLGPTAEGRAPRFQVLVDGQPPGEHAGVDVDAQGQGRAPTHRLYQLVRQRGEVRERTLEVRFPDAGARVFAFTFG
jgi:cytochrome c biogenesis protein CcdA/thiol-disulfide isomerase/thioredoxin